MSSSCRSLLVVVVLVAACGGSPRTPITTNPSTPAPGALPAAYAALFVAGEHAFPAERIVAMDGERTVDKGTVTCTIANVRPLAGGQAMDLTCTSALELPDSPAGTYVGTKDGLWRVETDATPLDPAKRLLPAVPVAVRTEHKDPDPDMEAGSAIIVAPHLGGWCVTMAGWGGDEGGWALCVRAGAGLVGGHGYFAGGSTRDVYFGDVKRD